MLTYGGRGAGGVRRVGACTHVGVRWRKDTCVSAAAYVCIASVYRQPHVLNMILSS
jgi:hypothetical protein